ncbi:probable inactive leucine-rich repeat receptor-like protein kinase At3g03770 isoform X2 [Abrus precatorius]|uniref:Probable inactive leucine-rich repeat receptor-like protein kinase At3g03770 isoform X2 n=1 Tax=Abrus precatorius TaxID=3816 RepID=A0A8B8LT42_ABRPR|nr:probable inactive leucine-rich repeat receptor-like protein kinase At3g03770 isoform X2 [Abrus precatorius]
MFQVDTLRCSCCLCFWVLSWFLLIPNTHGLQAAQTQALLQLRIYLEYPESLQIWENYNGDLCFLSSSANMSIKCEDDEVTELKIMGEKSVKPSWFNGFAVPNQTLSVNFSIDSFFTTLTRLTSLRVLSLVSLGIWGPLPDKIHRLSLLQVLDLSSNFMFGAIPPKISTMVKLHGLTLDDNYFNTTMPDWFDSLPNLSILSLKSNSLKGSFPSSLCKIRTLEVISLSHNELSGELPGLSSLTGLHVLDLRENHLESELPLLPKAVVTVLLSNNSLSGEIPKQFGKLDQLQHLDLSSNHLCKIPPSTLFSLPKISYLNLASNVLSGVFPDKLSCGSKLGFVDISSNKLHGELPSCLANTSDSRVVRYAGNCLSVDDSQGQHRGSYCKESSSGWKNFKAWKVAAVVAITVGLVLVLLVSGVFLWKKCHSRNTTGKDVLLKIVQDNSTTGVSSELLANARFISQTVKLGTQTTPTCRQFSIDELKEATKNFDSSTFIGEGSSGKLYKGKLENGSYVAIRSLALSKKCSIQNLKARLDLLSKLQHPNLVSLLGHCIDGGGQDDSNTHELHLIYEYVPNGNYRTHLSEKALKWSDRLAILIGVAKAVHFLHTGVIPGCFSNQLKTNNVLLDEHGIPKLSDYGMSIITEEIEKLEAKGEKPKSRLRPKAEDDVYNFGFILFESLVGPIACDKGETIFLHEKASFGSQDGRRKIVDPLVLTTCSQESLSIAISITTKCISPESSSRPSFEDVLWNLQYAAQVQATSEADQKSDSI